MNRETYDKGLAIRSAVLGEAYVNKALADADDFTKPLQDLVTEYCWGAVWGREELPRKTRSMLNLAMISALNRPHELRTHIKAALTNGVTRDEIREVFLQVAIYAGVPAAVDSFRIAGEVFAEADQELGPVVEIGFIGLGNMGFPMARRLIQGNHRVVAFDTRSETVDRAVALGAHAASSPKEVADRAETVLASLPSPTASLEVATGPTGVIEGSRVKRYRRPVDHR